MMWLVAPPKIICRNLFLVKAHLTNRSQPSALAAARTASPVLRPSSSMLVHPSADRGDQCNPGPSCRVRDRCTSRASRCGGAAQCRRGSKRQASSGNGPCVSLAFGAQLRGIKEQILEFDRLIRAWHRSNEMSMRLDEAPGVGPVLATALVAAVADPKSFRSGRNFSAWIGIVPKQHSSGGKNRLGNIRKQDDR